MGFNKGILFKDKHQDKVEYLKNKDDANLYASSNKRVKLTCPICSFEKDGKLNDLGRYGFYCNKCGSFNSKYPDKIKYLKNKKDGENKYSSLKKVETVCLDCGTIKVMTLDNLGRRNFNCNHCNSFEVMRPDKIVYLKNKDDRKLSFKANKKVRIKCPQCEFEKVVLLSNFADDNFNCNVCNDGISIGEKFIIELLKLINVQFKREYSPEWAMNKRYDFYIPNNNMIIEVHGNQHFSSNIHYSWGTLEEIKSNDKFKKENALKNGIINYIELNFEDPTLENMSSESILKLSDYLQIDNVDFNAVYNDANNSILIRVCNDYKNTDKKVDDIARENFISRTTVYGYLSKMKIKTRKELSHQIKD